MAGPSVVVLGGGISGLCSAYYTKKLFSAAGVQATVTLLEKSDTFGGWIKTLKSDRAGVAELGPRSLRASGDSVPAAFDLVSDLDLSKHVINIGMTAPAASNRYLYIDNKIHHLPRGLKGLLTKGSLLSEPLICVLLKEAFKKPMVHREETIFDFVSRRFSPEIAQKFADPMVRGVFAGDCKKLSVDACFPILKNLEKDHRSVVKGMLSPFKKKKTSTEPLNPLGKRAKAEMWSIWSFDEGLEVLPKTLRSRCDDLGVLVKSQSECVQLQHREDGLEVHCSDGEVLTADHVVSTLAANDLGKVLTNPKLSSELMAIEAVDVVVVNLAYDINSADMLQGFGHLIPSTEGEKVLGITYDSCIFPQHDGGAGLKRFTVMIGGAWYDEVFSVPPEQLSHSSCEQIAIDAMEQQLGVKVAPEWVKVTVHPRSIPQYHVGHLDRLNRLDCIISDSGIPLSLTGSSYKGVSVLDCIANARKTSENVVKTCI